MYDGPDNDDRATWADEALDALIEAAKCYIWPLADAAREDAYNELARAALRCYAATTRHYPVTCFDRPTPGDTGERDDAIEIIGDLLCDLRHLLDRHGLDVDAIHAAPPADGTPQPTADGHLASRLAWDCLRQYAATAGMDFDGMDERGAYNHGQEVAEAAVYIPAELEPVPARPAMSPTPLGRLSYLHDLYAWSVLRLVRKLRTLSWPW